jgi:hypothetical protein
MVSSAPSVHVSRTRPACRSIEAGSAGGLGGLLASCASITPASGAQSNRGVDNTMSGSSPQLYTPWYLIDGLVLRYKSIACVSV